jgi:glycosyltransferase involved in cell wall biosynthesis
MTTAFSRSLSMPLISVIMPAYNAERFIAAAVQSVMAQTFWNWELIIIDDASSDGTSQVMSGFCDPRIRFFTIPHIGSPAGVRNVALRLAKGDFIAFLDADDLYYSDTLEKLLHPLLENSRLGAVYGFPANMNETGQPLPPTVVLTPQAATETKPAGYAIPDEVQHRWENIVMSRTNCQLPSLMLRKSMLDGVGYFNEKLSGVEDYEFYLRLYLHDYDGVASLADYVYQYRIHTASLTKSPEHCRILLTSCLVILNWLFSEASLPSTVKPFRSLAFASAYRYLARERLLNGQPDLCRELLWKAIRDPNISPEDLARQCLGLMIRSFLPASLNDLLVRCRREMRARLSMSRLQLIQ